MLMSKHAVPALSPWEPSPRSANKAAEIKEPKRVDGPKNTRQASLKEPSLNPAPVESSYSFTINCNMDAGCIPLAFNFWFQKHFFLILFMCLWMILKNINSVTIFAFSDPLYFLFYQQTMSIAQLSSLNKPQVPLNPVLLFWNYLSIVHSSF